MASGFILRVTFGTATASSSAPLPRSSERFGRRLPRKPPEDRRYMLGFHVKVSSGVRLGPYEIAAPLGAGGMGEVYRARDVRLGRNVAIKVLPHSVSLDPDRLRRFETEARSASALNHPNIVTIYEIGSFDSVSYLAMELVEGT